MIDAPTPASGTPRPVYFDADGAPLFGCWHLPEGGGPPTGCVLICSPWGHEYFAAHRGLRQLGVRLGQAGWSALRFDFFGCGDSAGASDEGRMARWLADVAAAEREVRRSQPAGRPPILVGLGLGASLALLHHQQTPVSALVLWDPVVDGRASLDAHVALSASRDGGDQASGGERLGVPLSEGLRADLASLDLLAVTRAPAQVLLLDGPQEAHSSSTLVDRLRSLGSTVERQAVTYPPGWLEPGSSVVPAGAIQAILSWLRRRPAAFEGASAPPPVGP